jgi:pyruvate kinase
MRHTKIIATVGPASKGQEQLRALVDAGVDVFRLNFSHGSHESHRQVIARIREAARAADRIVAILQDLSGPKIRTGKLRGGEPIQLDPGTELRIAAGDFEGGPGRVSTTFAELPRSVKAGDVLLLDDGRIQLRVENSDGHELRATVVDGGLLGEHKGINAPGVTLSADAMTAKDVEDLKFGVAEGVDIIALSFVRSAGDLRQAREHLRAAGAPDTPLVAKLERPEAFEDLDAILHACEAVMVARGDLGLEVPLERVPRLQKEVTRRARSLGIPVIVATQVLESMRTESRPTRAEVSDAANAVDDGVDAIMLAGETAIGLYPVKTVQTLDAIVREAESIVSVGSVPLVESHLLAEHGRAICEAAVTLAEHGGAAAIVAITRGGKTARVLSALRPHVPVFAATDRAEIARRLAFNRGTVPLVIELDGDVNEAASRIGATLVERAAIPAGAVIVLVSVTPDLAKGPSNFLKIQRAVERRKTVRTTN